MKLERARRIPLKNKDHWLYDMPAWFRKLFMHRYYYQGIVHFENDKLAIIGDTVKWLDEFVVEATSEKAAEKLAFDYLHKKYPEYKYFIQLF